MSKIQVDEYELQNLGKSIKSILQILTINQKEEVNYEIKKIDLFLMEYEDIVQIKQQEKAYFNLYKKLEYKNPEESKKAYHYYKKKKEEKEKKLSDLNKSKSLV